MKLLLFPRTVVIGRKRSGRNFYVIIEKFMEFTLHAHFLPSHVHKKRAKLLRVNALFYYVFALFFLLVTFKTISLGFPGVLGYASNITISDLLKYTNAERKKNNLSELNYDPDLSKAAEAKANNMFKYNYWAHVSPTGVEPWYFFNEVNYDYSFAGENLAKNFNDSKSVVEAWMNSPSHRENMLNSNYTDIGFAVVNGDLQGYKTTLVVQFFGRKRGDNAPPSLDVSGTTTQKMEASEVISKTPQAQKFESETPKVPSATNVNAGEKGLLPEAIPNTPVVDVFLFTKIFSAILGLFFLGLFMLDFWYSGKKGIVKLTGHTIAHIFILLMAIVSIGFVMVPGRIGANASKASCCTYGK